MGESKVTLITILDRYIQLLSKGRVLGADMNPLSAATISGKMSRLSAVRSLVSVSLAERSLSRMGKDLRVRMRSIGEEIISKLNDAGFEDSSIVTIVNDVKSVLNWYNNNVQELPVGPYIKEIKYSAKEKSVNVFTESEQGYIVNNYKEIAEKFCTKAEAMALEYLVVGFLTAARVKDMASWTSSNIIHGSDEKWLRYIQSKNGRVIEIPVHHVAQDIFMKNIAVNGKCLPDLGYSPTMAIKSLLSKIPMFQEQCQVETYNRGVKRTILEPRWKTLSIHKTRGTAITNMLSGGVPEHIVKSFSGHTGNSKAFSRYVNAHKSEKLKALSSFMK